MISTSFLSSERLGSVSTALSCRDMSKFSVMPGLFQIYYYTIALGCNLFFGHRLADR